MQGTANKFVLVWAITLTAFILMGLTIPHTFTSGTTISSSQINDNFSATKTAVDALETRATDLEALVAALPSLDVTCHLSSEFGPISMPPGFTTGEMAKTVTYTPPSAEETAIYAEMRVQVTNTVQSAGISLRLTVYPVRGGVRGAAIGPVSTTNMETQVGTGLPDTITDVVSFSIPTGYPLPDSFDLVADIAGVNSGWVGTIDKVQFKVVAHKVRVTEKQNSTAIQ